jgi:predicted PurR-regulated permease PerM
MSPNTTIILRTALVVITVLAILGVAWLLVSLLEILLIVLIAAILATGLSPVVTALEQRRWTRRRLTLSRGAAILIVYVGLLATVALIAGLIITPVVIEARGFISNLSENLSKMEALLRGYQARYAWLPDFADLVRRLPEEASSATIYFAPAAGVAFRFIGGIATTITVLVLTFYMLIEGRAIREGLLARLPSANRERFGRVLTDVGVKFSGWLRGQLLLGVIIGVAAGVGMWAVGMPYPFLLGIVAGVTELIPIIGPVIGAVPAVFIGLFQPLWRLLFTIAWYALIQQAENNFLVPRVMRHTVGLSPLLTIIAVVIGAKLLGVVGVLLSVPVAAALQVIVGEILETFRPRD